MLKQLSLSTAVAVATLSIGVMAQSSHAAVLLSNLTSSVDGSYGGNPDSANHFTTGSVALNVTSIDVFWRSGLGGTAPQVGIFADNGGIPSTTQIGSFFTNSTPTSNNTLISYSGNVALAANTTYWMVVDIFDNSQVGYTLNQIATSDPSTQGASILAGSAFGDAQTGTWDNDPANLVYAINGTAVLQSVPEPSSLMGLALLGGGLLLKKRVKG